MQNRRIADMSWRPPSAKRLPITMSRPCSIERVQQFGDVLGDVLTVGIDLHDAGVSVLDGVAEAGAQRAADTEVDRQSHDLGAGRASQRLGAVGAAVVDHQTFEAERSDVGDDVGDAGLLVVGRHHDERARRGRRRRRGVSGHAARVRSAGPPAARAPRPWCAAVLAAARR